MYGHFIQFTIPKIGQALVAVVLYLNFLKLPFVACFAGVYPAVYLLLPLLLLAVMSWIGRDPLGPGMIVNSHLTGLYIAGDIVGLLARAIGGTVLTVWQTIWMGGLLAWVGTVAMMLWSYFKAMRLVTTTYRLQTTKPLPGGKLRVLQISDLHPGKGAVDRKRIPELNRRIRELNPDMILLPAIFLTSMWNVRILIPSMPSLPRWTRPAASGSCWATMICSTTGGSRAMAARTWRALLRGRTFAFWRMFPSWPMWARMLPPCALWAARTGCTPRVTALLPPS